MITVNEQPEQFVMVRNPVNYELETDNYIDVAGTKATIYLIMIGLTGNVGNITFNFLGKTVIFNSSPAAPTNAALAFNDGTAGYANYTLYTNAMIDSLKKSLHLNDNYNITIDVVGPFVGIVKIEGKEAGVKYNITASTTVTNFSFSAPTVGVDDLYRENFKILHDLFIEDTFNSDDFRLAFKGSAIPNEVNQASFNFSDVLRGLLSLHIPPYAVFTFMLNTTVKRFYTRYAESFGFPNITNPSQVTNTNYALLGAQGFVNAAMGDFTYNYFTYTPNKFLNSSPNNTLVDRYQKQYLSLFIPAAGTYNFRITFTYTDLTTSTANAAAMAIADAGFYTFETGYAALGMDALKTSGKTINKYTIRLKDTASFLTETKIYLVDNNYQLFTRYFLFFNSFGMPETIYFTGKQMNAVQSKNEVIRKADYGFDADNGIYEGETAEINNELQFGYELNSGWKTKEWLTFFNDFINSSKRLIQGSEKWIGVNIPAQKIALNEDDNTLYSVKFNYQDSFIEKGTA